MRYQAKHRVEAMQWTDTDENREKFAAWFESHDEEFETRGPVVVLPEGSGRRVENFYDGHQNEDASEGDWIIYDPDDDFFRVMSDDMFKDEYAPISWAEAAGIDKEAWDVAMHNLGEQKERADKAESNLEKWRNCFICIDCGKGKVDEEALCTSCGRDTIWFDNGKFCGNNVADHFDAVERELTKERDALAVRVQELLIVIRTLSQQIPYEEEHGSAGLLIAEVGTLRAKVAELTLARNDQWDKRRAAEAATEDIRRDCVAFDKERCDLAIDLETALTRITAMGDAIGSAIAWIENYDDPSALEILRAGLSNIKVPEPQLPDDPGAD